MADRGGKLVRLAEEHFGSAGGVGVTEPERAMLHAAASGETCNLLKDEDQQLSNDTADRCWQKWGRHRIVRAQLIRWLCSDPDATRQVDPRGIELEHALVSGDLDLYGCTIPWPIALHRCAVPGGLDFAHATLRMLALPGCRVGSITADGLVAHGDVALCDGFVARGVVRMVRARVSGAFDCSDGTFINRTGMAIQADGITADIIRLDRKFHAHGQVRLVAAEIRQNLQCCTATIQNPKKQALALGGISVGGSMFLNSLEIEGDLVLNGSRIEGRLESLNVELTESAGTSFSADGVKVGGALVMRGGFRSDGLVDLTDCRVGSLMDEEASWPSQIVLGGFQYGSIFAGSPCDAERRLKWLSRHDETVAELAQVEWIKHYRFDPQPYRQLAGVLRRQGHDRDADRIMIAAANKRMAETKELWRRGGRNGAETWRSRLCYFLAWAWQYALWLSLGHGYRRGLPALWLAVLFLIGCGVFDFNAEKMQPRDSRAALILGNGEASAGFQPPYRLKFEPILPSHDSIRADEAPPRRSFQPIIYSVDTLIPLVDLREADRWLPTPGPVRWYLWFHITMGWTFSTLFVVGLTGLVRRASTGEGSG